MRRRIVIFLLVLWPLQFSWTAAAAYCQHETSAPQARHVGHHFHAHQGADFSNASGTPTAAGAADGDCASCHAAGAAVLPVTVAVASPVAASTQAADCPSRPITSALARAPDRPQWRRLV